MENGNGKWKMENGKWKMENGNGKCGMNGNMNIDYLLHISCIVFCLNQPNKKRK